MIEKLQNAQARTPAAAARGNTRPAGGAFDAMLQQRVQAKGAQPRQAPGINFSKHAMARAEERGIELTPTLLEQLQTSVDKAQEKGATNILAFNTDQAFIINVPYERVITTMTQEEMRENCFTNIDGAVLI